MGDEFKQCLDKDRFDRCEKDYCKHDDYICSHEHSDDWGFGDWLPIIIIVFLLCGGTNIFGGFGCRDDCCEGGGGFGGSWLLILLVVFLFLGNQRGEKGFLGGLFG